MRNEPDSLGASTTITSPGLDTVLVEDDGFGTKRVSPTTSSSVVAAGGGFFCSVCGVRVCEDTLEQHQCLTLHLLNEHPEPRPPRIWIPEDNKGRQMLKTMGWDAEEGNGLGRLRQGRRVPVPTQLRRDRSGIGNGKASSRVTHFPSHVEAEQLSAPDGLSRAKRTQNARNARIPAVSAARMRAVEREARRERERAEAARISSYRLELFSDLPDELLGLAASRSGVPHRKRRRRR